MMAAKDLRTAPNHMTNTSMAHTARVMVTIRGRKGTSPARSKPRSIPVTANSMKKTSEVRNPTWRPWSSLPAIMAVSRRPAVIRCQFRPSCSPVAVWAVNPPMVRGRNSVAASSMP